ncbi:MAG: TrmB family transcriptional regulator [Candidatus Aenigmarchaeota archaeon]|nr:TrmB family transcriptional regulator [Candidatus Aenigmarchaeota archaeon]
MPDDSIVESFQELGFTGYQARVLAALYGRSNLTGAQVAQLSGVPVTKIYGVLDQLGSLGVVFYSPQRPKKYQAAEPDEIISIIIDRKQSEIKKLRDQGKQTLAGLKKAFTADRSMAGDKVLFFPSNESVWNAGAVGVWKDAKTNAVSFGSKEVWLDGLYNHPKFWEAATRSMNKGVQHRSLVPRTMANDAANILKNSNKAALVALSHENFHTRVVADEPLHYGGMAADEKILGFAFQDPKTNKVTSGIRINDSQVTKSFLERYFYPVWNNGQDYESLLRGMARRELKRRGN